MGANLRALLNCLGREAEAIARRDLGQIAELTNRKSELADSIQSMIDSNSGASKESFGADLDAVLKIAQDNAQKLKNFRDGVARARQRMTEITNASGNLGAYQASGRPLKVRQASGAERCA
jgi:uncharacterized protein YukE